MSTDTNETVTRITTSDGGDYCLLGVSDNDVFRLLVPTDWTYHLQAMMGLLLVSLTRWFARKFPNTQRRYQYSVKQLPFFVFKLARQNAGGHGGHTTVGYVVVYAKVSGHPTNANNVSTLA